MIHDFDTSGFIIYPSIQMIIDVSKQIVTVEPKEPLKTYPVFQLQSAKFGITWHCGHSPSYIVAMVLTTLQQGDNSPNVGSFPWQ